MTETISPADHVRGTIELPGDKSISHRALMIAAIAEGESRIENLSDGEDVRSTMQCLKQMGVAFREDGNLVVNGVGLDGLQQAGQPLDVGNSGTTIRLMSGVLSGQDFTTVITGDESVRTRPMLRIIEPLRRMGATVEANQNEFAPLTIQGGPLNPVTYAPAVASAQVKSCLLLAGLYADGKTSVIEKSMTRDHTELMLQAFGAEVSRQGLQVNVQGRPQLQGQDVFVPGDLSSGAYFLAAACLLPGSEVVLKNVGLNPTRKAFLSLLCDFGADVEILNARAVGHELMADLLVRSSALGGMTIGPGMVPQVIDEIPVLAIMATQALGRTEIRGAGELRHKESDRLRSLVFNLKRMGANVEELKDGLIIEGPTRLHGAEIETFHDHRIAMSFAIAGLIAEDETEIKGSEIMAVSYPGFMEALNRLTLAG